MSSVAAALQMLGVAHISSSSCWLGSADWLLPLLPRPKSEAPMSDSSQRLLSGSIIDGDLGRREVTVSSHKVEQYHYHFQTLLTLVSS